MNYFERYRKLILDKTEKGELTEEFVTQTTSRIEFYYQKGKLTEEQHNELITLLNPND